MLTNVEIFDWASVNTATRCPPFYTCPASELLYKSGAKSVEITPLYKKRLGSFKVYLYLFPFS